MNQPTVYLVDDDHELRVSLKSLLQALGYATRAFSSAESFLKAATPTMAGCVIVDQQMPGMSGLELLQMLQGSEADALPAIFMTAHADIPTAVSAMKHGAFDVLEKPVECEELISKIEAALRHDHQRQSLRKERDRLLQKFQRLSAREKETLELLRQGLPNKAIAAQLQITERAVEMRRARIMHKLEARSIAELYETFASYRLLTKTGKS